MRKCIYRENMKELFDKPRVFRYIAFSDSI